MVKVKKRPSKKRPIWEIYTHFLGPFMDGQSKVALKNYTKEVINPLSTTDPSSKRVDTITAVEENTKGIHFLYN